MESYSKGPRKVRDQAETLRKHRIPMKTSRAITRVISFTSGKGGVGKTNSVVNIAVALARLGKTSLILDADLGLANVNVLLGIQPQHTLHDVFSGRKSLSDIIVSGPEGINIIPAASGVESICDLTDHQKLSFLAGIEQVAYQYDYLLIDTRAGISGDVMYFNSASSEVICVINNEPTSLTDAYAVIKVLSQNYGERSIRVISNNVKDEQEGLAAFRRLSRAVEKFLQVDLKYLGFVPRDSAVTSAIQAQRPVLELFPTSLAARSLERLSKTIDEEFLEYRVKGGMQFFFEQILSVGTHGY